MPAIAFLQTTQDELLVHGLLHDGAHRSLPLAHYEQSSTAIHWQKPAGDHLGLNVFAWYGVAVVQQGISAVSLDSRRIQTMSLSRQQIPHQAETKGLHFQALLHEKNHGFRMEGGIKDCFPSLPTHITTVDCLMVLGKQ